MLALFRTREKKLVWPLFGIYLVSWIGTLQFASRNHRIIRDETQSHQQSKADAIRLQQQDVKPAVPGLIRSSTAIRTTIHATKISPANTSFCVPWDIDSDTWWTHNADWEISFENDTHYCFQHLPHKKAELFRSIYQTQFHGNCSAAVTKSMWNSGWGADLSNAVDGLRYAHEVAKRPLSVWSSPVGWHYAAKKDGSRPACELRSMQCYFLNLTACTPPKYAVGTRESFLMGSWRGFYPSRSYLEFLVRPQTWLRHRVYDFARPYLEKLTTSTTSSSTSCTVIHVRRGDAILRDPTPRRYHALEEYMNATNITSTVLLLTDDHNAIGEALYKFPTHNWVYINRTRYKGPEGGWENHIPSDDPQQEVIAILAALRLVRHCQILVHSKSNLADYIYSEMKAEQPKVIKVNLDQGQGNKVHHVDNPLSVHLSRAYK